jgi:hypothetical protein
LKDKQEHGAGTIVYLALALALAKSLENPSIPFKILNQSLVATVVASTFEATTLAWSMGLASELQCQQGRSESEFLLQKERNHNEWYYQNFQKERKRDVPCIFLKK